MKDQQSHSISEHYDQWEGTFVEKNIPCLATKLTTSLQLIKQLFINLAQRHIKAAYYTKVPA